MAASESNEIRLTRIYDAPASAVWDAWTVPDQVAKWWGPRGFTITTHHKDLRVGGTWRYTMHGPDGTDYPNVTTYFVVESHRKLVYDHGASGDRPPLFRVTVTFSEVDGKTTMDLVFALATPEAARETAKFIKKAGGNGTWDRLAEHLEATATGKPILVVNRVFDAPIARVFQAWTDPDKLAAWLPSAGTQLRLTLEPPRRVVYLESSHPALLTTVLLTEEAPDRTRVTVTSAPYSEATPVDLQAFVAERAGMALGWTGSFDVLEDALAAKVAG